MNRSLRNILVKGLVFTTFNHNPLLFSTGAFLVGVHYTFDGVPTTYEYSWQGGGSIAITQSLLEDAEPTVLRRKENLLYVGPYVIELYAFGIEGNEIIYLGWKNDYTASCGFGDFAA